MSTVLVIDNYDSFTYNLVQYLGELGASVVVHRNDAIGLSDVENLGADGIVISPGPCAPDSAGISVELIRRFAGLVPMLGVCLGHQAIGAAFGARVVRNHRILHGKTSDIHHSAIGILSGLPNPFVAGRYHSLVIDGSSLPDELAVTAWTDQGEIMGIQHREHEIAGVQFHPESVLTPNGRQLLANWLSRVGEGV
ncbi:MAG: aminodeoxychorismate/anthranilate synthase component II [Acidimicrobiales bacterium]